MLRAIVSQTAKAPEAQAALLLPTRGYLSSLSLDFVEDVSGPSKPSRTAPSVTAEWTATKGLTEKMIKLMQTYKEVGDSKAEPLLKYHNPRTFESFDHPIPNFRKFNLKAGEVPKFFDNVLLKRADECVQLKNDWWHDRKQEVEEKVKGKDGKLPTLPVPAWDYGKPVTLAALNAVTDAYVASLEPRRKLRLPTLPAQVSDALTAYTKSLGQEGAVADIKVALLKMLAEKAVVEENGKVLTDFKFTTKAEAEGQVASKRSEVHARWLKLWAKQLGTTPEQALIPLKERDALIASNFEDVSTKYNDLVDAVSFGTESYGQRLAGSAELNAFLLRRDKDKVEAEFPITEKEKEAIALSKQLDDRAYALTKLLGPALHPEGNSGKLPSEEVDALTEHLYTPDRYFYKEGKALVKKLQEIEAQTKEELKATYGDNVDVAAHLRSPRGPVAALFDRLRELEGRQAEFAAERDAVQDDPYLLHAVTKRQELLKDPASMSFDEVLYPSLTEEWRDIALAEVDAKARQVDEAEEEELWMLTLLAQARHIHQQIEFDLPQSAIAYMDPLLYKKLDWETTNGQDLLHHELNDAADSEQGQFLKDMWALENLSHHFLPLIRYRRKKAKALHGFYAPEKSSIKATATSV